MQKTDFKPYHINASPEDLAGNQGIGRYIFLPGSDGRAKAIAEHFNELTVKNHPRGHHLYLGTLSSNGHIIEVAATSSGMGCPSMEIILHELFHLGAKRFLRVGTTGSLQPKEVFIGDYVNVAASVRDESTTRDYVPAEMPAIASNAFINSINHAANTMSLLDKVHTGIVHCKSSFYAREFGEGPRHSENMRYLELLQTYGVLASEMETAALLVQSQLYNHQLNQKGKDVTHKVLCGALLAVLAIPFHAFANKAEETEITNHLIALAIESVKTLANSESAATS
ncbi:MAG: hypothetical protein A3F14_02175 [Gammaproteobacteria bacterium RIFCSPHIGHO2_12_FULL_43_28]|nr:MAG: hypothetical protein A3F14_02175 [Gammaproteobacteria bacterium RIFCSPHIGHO2_12_FULL_43_28]